MTKTLHKGNWKRETGKRRDVVKNARLEKARLENAVPKLRVENPGKACIGRQMLLYSLWLSVWSHRCTLCERKLFFSTTCSLIYVTAKPLANCEIPDLSIQHQRAQINSANLSFPILLRQLHIDTSLYLSSQFIQIIFRIANRPIY